MEHFGVYLFNISLKFDNLGVLFPDPENTRNYFKGISNWILGLTEENSLSLGLDISINCVIDVSVMGIKIKNIDVHQELEMEFSQIQLLIVNC